MYFLTNNSYSYRFFFVFLRPNMLRMPKFISRALSVRISLMVVFSMAILLVVTMSIMLHYSKKAVREESFHKAVQTLEATVSNIDNILLSVEQSAGNMYFSLLPYLDNPDIMYTYSRKLVETNPYVVGCAIAFKPGYYQSRDKFMVYVHRADSAGVPYVSSFIVNEKEFGNRPYTEQSWFTTPMASGKSEWLNPLVGMEKAHMEPLLTFCLPLRGKDHSIIGVIGVNISLSQLSRIISATKTSKNSYCVLLDCDGTFIVHPFGNKLMRETALALSRKMGDEAATDAVETMLSGEAGYRKFRLEGNELYGFFKPFKRVSITGRPPTELGWSAAIVYPEADILGEYNNLLYYMHAIAIIGLLLLFFLCRTVIRHRLNPLIMLSEKAKLIAEGNYNAPIPDSNKLDEIGRLQKNFQLMQQSLNNQMSELDKLKITMQGRSEVLRIAYRQARKAQRMKMAFLHNMTNQMVAPAKAIFRNVSALTETDSTTDKKEIVRLVNEIHEYSKTITEQLNSFISMSDEERRKEADHV